MSQQSQTQREEEIAIFWTALHPTNEEDLDNWSPATTITTPTIITTTTTTTN